jgi:hypothetical protein
MILRLVPLLLGALLFALPGRAATNTAQLSFHCQSVRLSPASVNRLGLTYSVSFTTVDGEPNGELGIDEDANAPTFMSTVIMLEHPVLQETLFAKLFLDVPDTGDADINRIGDFFQVGLPVEAAKSLGAFEDEFFGLVVVTATWNRPAGSAFGVCAMELKGEIVNATFQVPFEIFQYVGTLRYGPNTNVVAEVSLQRQGAPGSLSGVWNLSEAAPGELTFPGDQWRDESGNVYRFIPADEIEAYLTHITRQFYNGLAGLVDGMPSTPATKEYIVWEFNVFDPNDADGDRVPDLSDPPTGVGPVLTPVVSVVVEEQFLRLRITARKGQSVIIERKATLGAAEWSEVETVSLAEDTVTKDLPLSGDDSDFYRVRQP